MKFRLPRPSLSQSLRYLAGIFVVSIGATLGIRSGLGGAPYDALLSTITEVTGVPFWVAAWTLQAVWLGWIVGAGGRVDVGTLLHSLSFGPIMSATLAIVPEATALMQSILYVTGAVAGIATGLWLYLGAGFVAGMVDTLFETLSVRRGWRPATIRTTFDVACCAVAWTGGGPVGAGTVIVALGVAPLLALLDRGLLRPESWRGIPLGGRRPEALPVELVDTTELQVIRHV